jgi:hypothetical protein
MESLVEVFRARDEELAQSVRHDRDHWDTEHTGGAA